MRKTMTATKEESGKERVIQKVVVEMDGKVIQFPARTANQILLTSGSSFGFKARFEVKNGSVHETSRQTTANISFDAASALK